MLDANALILNANAKNRAVSESLLERVMLRQ
jgi:hypothetical protein